MGVSMHSATYNTTTGGGGGNGGYSPNSGDDDGRHRWAAYREVTRYTNGTRLAEATLGSSGYTYRIWDQRGDQKGKITGHSTGVLHRHGAFSASAPKDDFVRYSTEIPFSGMLGAVIRKI
jgi:hypothetical protein